MSPAVAFSVLAAGTERLDRFLADQLSLSRTQAGRLIAAGRVRIGVDIARASRLLSRGDEVRVAFPEPEPPRTIAPLDIPLAVVYQDDALLVIDKPAGLVVHPAPGHWDDTLVNVLSSRGHGPAGGPEGRAGIVHRLDRDTSGLMVVARSEEAHRRLGAALAARRVQRRYAALTWGHFDPPRTMIDAPIGRHGADRKRMTVTPKGRTARTDVEVVARFEVVDLLRLTLHSGRTHQIRVHLDHAGHPVVGDPVYHGGGSRRISGAARRDAELIERAAPRQALHAAELAFRHPSSGQPLRFRSEWPTDLRQVLEAAAGSHVAGANPLAYLGFFAESHG